MPLVLALLAYTGLTIVAAPLVLTRGHWRMRRPGLALILWHGAFLSGIAAAIVSMVVAVALAVGVNGMVPTMRTDAFGPTVIVVSAWLALAIVGGLSALVLARAEPLLELDREAEKSFADLLDSGFARSERVGRLTIRFIASSLPIACTSPGRRAEVIVSTRLQDELSAGELRAVIEHERAHLRHRHALVKRLALINSACLPGVLGATEFKRATDLLIELIADDSAARVCGHHQVSMALARIAELRSSAGLVARSDRLLQLSPNHVRATQRRADARPSVSAEGVFYLPC
ncbi:Peptidase family M48 [Plantibacter sp. VKM Ac-1784]|uniref:Peptidase family M48 n=1 Tax=Plantibacter elymi (nom. nud.) TaxID=199708 RepID=A0ABY1RFP9_9MICO|nr:M56 family metallopeptidase [Plantibacter sp. VKM Ac-1784]SMQ71205.1 Peptidase family M48 [Plantibacter sp. VKM Ac-1784]